MMVLKKGPKNDQVKEKKARQQKWRVLKKKKKVKATRMYPESEKSGFLANFH
jgi:hypothetical protein